MKTFEIKTLMSLNSHKKYKKIKIVMNQSLMINKAAIDTVTK